MNNKSSVVKIPAIPVVVKKGSPLTLLKNVPKNELLLRCINLGIVHKEQLIYKSVPGDFLRGEFPGLTLVSRLNVFNKTSSTVAKFIYNRSVIEKNSHDIIKVIGQKNYETVFSAISSVISQELRIRALLALLTIEDGAIKKSATSQTEKSYADASCQTDETLQQIFEKNFKQRRRVKRQQFRPYVVTSFEEKKIKRVVIDPRSLHKPIQNNSKTHGSVDASSNSTDPTNCVSQTETRKVENESFPELSGIVNEDSNFSDTSVGNISITSQLSLNIPQLLENPNLLLQQVDNHTEPLNSVPLTLLDGSVIMVCAKPIDKFHWATPDILKSLSYADQTKVMTQQVIIHWKYCLERDEDGFLPIHQAVMTNDIDFLKPQCAALKNKYGSVDVAATGNITPLQMSIYKGGERCTALLLQSGADPYLQDDEGKSFFHTAAEVSHEHLKIALDHCRRHARTILQEDEDMWNPEMENQNDEQLAKSLLDHICIMCDNQGYTPLMLASKQGNHTSVKLLLEASPDTVNRPMPNCGSTALYLAVGAACIEASSCKHQTKVSENFLKTIEYLMEYGGDPNLENHSNSSVNILLTEFNIVDLSVLIANKLTSVKYFDGNTFAASNINSLMLYKNSDGKVDVTEIRSKKTNDARESGVAVSASNNAKCTIKHVITNSDIQLKNNRKDRNRNKESKIEIKEIKTVTVNKAATGGGARTALDGHCTPSPVNIKPSHFIIVPKMIRPDVPKYVKILPKLDKSGQSGGGAVQTDKLKKINKAKRKIAPTKTKNVTVEKTEKPKKYKRNRDGKSTAAKRPRKDTRQTLAETADARARE